MSEKKQSFRFRLPWLPSLVSAPGRSALSQRSRKSTPPSIPVDLMGMNMIPIERHMEDVESEFPARPESQTPLRIGDLEPIQAPQLNQQQLIEGVRLRKPTDYQSPYGKVEASAREESAEFHIHLSGTDSTPLQLSNTSSAPLQTTPDQATKSQEAESQHLSETEFPSPSATKTPPRSPARDSKLHSPSKGAKLVQQKPQLSKSSSSSSSSSPQKLSPARSKSKPHSPSHAGTSTHSNPKPLPDKGNHTRPSAKQLSTETGNHARSSVKQLSPDAGNHTRTSAMSSPEAGIDTRSSGKHPSPDLGNHTRSSGKQPSPDAGNHHTRSSGKQPSLDAGIHTRSSEKQPSPSRDADTRTASLPHVPSHTVKLAKTLSKSSPTSSSSSSTSLSSSHPYSPSSQSSTSSYLTGESLNSSSKQLTSSPTPNPKNSPQVQNSKPKTHASQEMKHRSTLPQEESNQPDAIKSTDMEAIRANESNTPGTVYDKMAPEPSHTKFKGHPNPSTEEASENEKEESRKSARHKRMRKLFLKRVSPRKKILMPHNSHKDEGESSTIPLYKKIKNDVSNFTDKISSEQLRHSTSEDHPVSIINISGSNKGATLHLNGKATRQVNVANSDTDGSKSQEPQTKYEQQKRMTCINSNIQSINNSLLLKSSVHERNPGVHFGSQVNNTKSAPAGLKRIEPSSTDDVHEKEMTVTTASKLEYNTPIIKRRCLRGLLMESSESEADNPDKPRRHGCRVAWIELNYASNNRN